MRAEADAGYVEVGSGGRSQRTRGGHACFFFQFFCCVWTVLV